MRSAFRLLMAAVVLSFAVLLAGCARHPELAPPPLPALGEAAVQVDPRTGEHSVELSVLTYNVAGLPWPRRSGTGRAMQRIAEIMEARA